MKKFDSDYEMLKDMYQDGYFPDFLVDKIKCLLQEMVAFLETGEKEVQTAARESIGETVEYILNWFDIDMDVEDAIGQRDW